MTQSCPKSFKQKNLTVNGFKLLLLTSLMTSSTAFAVENNETNKTRAAKKVIEKPLGSDEISSERAEELFQQLQASKETNDQTTKLQQLNKRLAELEKEHQQRVDAINGEIASLTNQPKLNPKSIKTSSKMAAKVSALEIDESKKQDEQTDASQPVTNETEKSVTSESIDARSKQNTQSVTKARVSKLKVKQSVLQSTLPNNTLTKAPEEPAKNSPAPITANQSKPKKKKKTGIGSDEITIEEVDLTKYDITTPEPTAPYHTAKINNATINRLNNRDRHSVSVSQPVTIHEEVAPTMITGLTNHKPPKQTNKTSPNPEKTVTQTVDIEQGTPTPASKPKSVQNKLDKNGEMLAIAPGSVRVRNNFKPINQQNVPVSSNTSQEALKINNNSASELYLNALQAFAVEDTETAIHDLQAYINNYPNEPLIAKAHYWLGEAQLQREPANYASARFEFIEVIDRYQSHPNNDKHSKALYRLSQLSKINNYDDELKLYTKILQDQYPDSEESKLAQQLLSQ